jgi:hypothetical protein
MELPHEIKPYESKVYQKGLGGLAPRLQLQLGPRSVEELRLRREAHEWRVGNRVAAVRAEAAAQGVHVVVDDTRPDTYSIVRVYD